MTSNLTSLLTIRQFAADTGRTLGSARSFLHRHRAELVQWKIKLKMGKAVYIDPDRLRAWMETKAAKAAK